MTLARNPPSDSLDLYREVLRSQPDGSVTIVSVGFLNNLDVLLREERELVAEKVRQLVVMGGRHNDGFNLVRHNLVDVTKRVITDWPTPLAITDFGGSVRTGTALEHASPDNPVREAYLSDFGRRKPAECRQGERTAWAGARSVVRRQRFLWRSLPPETSRCE